MRRPTTTGNLEILQQPTTIKHKIEEERNAIERVKTRTKVDDEDHYVANQ